MTERIKVVDSTAAPRMSISTVTARRRSPGTRLHASLERSCGSIGSAAPGTYTLVARRRAPARGGLGGLALDVARERAPQPAVEHQALEHVAGDLRPPEPAHDPSAAVAEADEHELALHRAVPRAAVEGVTAPALEQRLGDEQPAAALDRRDERLGRRARPAPAAVAVPAATASAAALGAGAPRGARPPPL